MADFETHPRGTVARLEAEKAELVEALEFLANVARCTNGFSPMALKQADNTLTKHKDTDNA